MHDSLWVWKYMVINWAWGAWLLTECVWVLGYLWNRVVSLSYGSMVTLGGQDTSECFQQKLLKEVQATLTKTFFKCLSPLYGK